MSDTSGTCFFLGLPLETRQQIYGYLLSTKSTKKYVLHKAPELVRRNQRHVSPRSQHRPGHVYCFQTAILRTNSQINKEAEHVLYNKNQFVSISHHYHCEKTFSHLPELFNKEGIKEFFERRGFPILATGQTALDFKNCAMDVMLGLLPSALNSVWLETWWNSAKRKSNGWRTRSIFLIACDDLQQLCRVILEVHHLLQGTTTFRSRDNAILLVDVVNRGDQLKTCSRDGSVPINAKVQRLLEPFRRLHNIGNVIITGQMNEQYKSGIVASMMKGPPTAEDIIGTACATRAEGDKAFGNKDFSLSVSAYEKAYGDVEAGLQPSVPFAVVAEGRYAGLLVSNAKEHLLFSLLLSIIAALLQLREYQNAYNWTNMELYIHRDVVCNADVARIWHLKSQASRGLGLSKAAHYQLVQAVLLHPQNKDMAADLGNMTAGVLQSSAATLKWASSSRG